MEPSTQNTVPAYAGTSKGLPLFYKKPVVLRFEEHKTKALAPVRNYEFAGSTNAVPISIGEFMPVIRNFPIVFAEAELPFPVAVMGLKQGQNIFLEPDKTWRVGVYIPAYIRRYPFVLTQSGDKKVRALSIDAACDRFVDVDDSGLGRPLFKPDGTATPLAAEILAFCQSMHAQHLQTTEFVKALKESNLLVAKSADTRFADNSQYKLQGFQIVDADRFRALPAKTLSAWQERGWLNAVSLHLASLQNWQHLLELDRAVTQKAAV